MSAEFLRLTSAWHFAARRLVIEAAAIDRAAVTRTVSLQLNCINRRKFVYNSV